MNRRGAKRALSQWMKSARKKLGKTQDDLSVQLGCSGVHVSQMERGRRMPSDEILLKITLLLECNHKEIRGLFLLRMRALSDVTLEDFEKLFGNTDDMTAIAGLETHRFIALMQNAEATLLCEEFSLLSGAIMQVVALARMKRDSSL